MEGILNFSENYAWMRYGEYIADCIVVSSIRPKFRSISTYAFFAGLIPLPALRNWLPSKLTPLYYIFAFLSRCKVMDNVCSLLNIDFITLVSKHQ